MVQVMRLTAVILVLGVAGLGFARVVDETGAGVPVGIQEQKQAQQEDAPSSDSYTLFPAVVATVNGSPILGRELERGIRNELLSMGSPPWENLRQEYRNELINRHLTILVGTELLYQEAKSKAVQVGEEEIQANLDQTAETYPDAAAFDAALAERGTDREGYRKELGKSLMATKYARGEIEGKVVVTPEEVSEYYNTHTDEFRHGDLVWTSHILVRTMENATEAQVDSARERAEAILKRAKAGEDFAALLEEFSGEPSAVTGGDLGYTEREQLPAEYGEAAFALEVGAISDLVRTSYGFHIIKVTDKRQAGLATLPEVRESLTNLIRTQKENNELDKLIQQLREEADLNFFLESTP